jgi:archaemetzincin
VSLARLADERDPERARRRILASALHEAGHALTLPHCVFFHCLMNPASRLDEIDRRPLLLCPVCRAKVCWNLGLEPVDRYAKLEAALARAGLPEEARRVHAAAGATQRKPCE